MTHDSENAEDTPENQSDHEHEKDEGDYPELASLAEALSDRASIVLDGEEAPYVEVEKLGETYLVFPDGTVRGNVLGPELAKFAAEHLEANQ